MGLLWTFMGASAAYTIFAGLGEVVGGRWRRLIFSYPRQMALQTMAGARQRYALELDATKKIFSMTKRDDPKWSAMFTYRQPDPQHLPVTGTFDGRKIQARLSREDESQFLLTNRGFHWINEYPCNR